MSRPTPRKSSLSGSNLIAPPVAAATEPAEVAAPPAAAPPAPVVKAQSKPASKPAAGPGEGKKYRPKVSFYQDPADTILARSCTLRCRRGHDRCRSSSTMP